MLQYTHTPTGVTAAGQQQPDCWHYATMCIVCSPMVVVVTTDQYMLLSIVRSGYSCYTYRQETSRAHTGRSGCAHSNKPKMQRLPTRQADAWVQVTRLRRKAIGSSRAGSLTPVFKTYDQGGVQGVSAVTLPAKANAVESSKWAALCTSDSSCLHAGVPQTVSQSRRTGPPTRK